MVTVIDEVLAVGVVGVGRKAVAGGHQPVAVLVVEEQPVQLFEEGHVAFHQRIQARQLRRAETFGLDPLDQSDQHGVGLLDRIAGVLRQRARQVAHRHLGSAQRLAPRGPGLPDVQREDGDEHHADEQQCQALDRQPGPGVGVVIGGSRHRQRRVVRPEGARLLSTGHGDDRSWPSSVSLGSPGEACRAVYRFSVRAAPRHARIRHPTAGRGVPRGRAARRRCRNPPPHGNPPVAGMQAAGRSARR